MNNNIKLSICIPVFNEEEVLKVFSERLFVVLREISDVRHEVIFVNDGSIDSSHLILDELVRNTKDLDVINIHLSRNFGHQIAISAALNNVSGDACVIMDADLQDKPESIPELLSKFYEGYDVVYARRIKRKESLFFRFSYSLFYRLVNSLSQIELPIDAGDFSIISKRVVEDINSCSERNRYLRGLRAWSGYKQTGIEIERGERFKGESKYSIIKLIGLALDGICSFSIVPLRLAVFFGALGVLFCFLFLIYAVFAYLVLGSSPPGFTVMVFFLSFLSSLQLLSMGVLGEYLGKVYTEVKKRPLYVVDRVEKNTNG